MSKGTQTASAAAATPAPPAESQSSSSASSSSAASSASSSSLSSPSFQTVREHKQFIRGAVNSALSAGKSSSRVLEFAINTVEKNVSPVYERWDPLLSCIDDQLDSVVSAVKNVSLNHDPVLSAPERTEVQSPSDEEDLSSAESDDEELQGDDGGNRSVLDSQSSPYTEEHWNQLRSNFMRSNWFLKVDEILSENFVLNPMVAKPAEVFFNTAMDVYLTSTAHHDFMKTLKERLGSAWDDRLSQPASVFFSTARTVASIVGVRRFMHGAMNLGKTTVNFTLSQLLQRWDQILGLTDNVLDYILPDYEGSAESNHQQQRDKDSKEGEQFEIDSGVSDDSQSKKRPRSVVEIASKVTRRVKQRMPTLESITLQVKTRLFSTSWFQKVDEILMQNVLMQSLGTLMRPAEHFYDTALNIFVEKRRTLDEFLFALKLRLGAAWDDRLTGPATEFYESATETSDNEEDDH